MSPEVITERAVRRAFRLQELGRYHSALDCLQEALEHDPLCREILVHIGDLYLYDSDELGLDQDQGDRKALEFYDRAIAAWPDHAEAYAEKSQALLYFERYEEALACAERGLQLFDQPPTTDLCPGVWTNVGESLYRRSALALKELGRASEGRARLHEGLRRFPESQYLTQATRAFLPDLE